MACPTAFIKTLLVCIELRLVIVIEGEKSLLQSYFGSMKACGYSTLGAFLIEAMSPLLQMVHHSLSKP